MLLLLVAFSIDELVRGICKQWKTFWCQLSSWRWRIWFC